MSVQKIDYEIVLTEYSNRERIVDLFGNYRMLKAIKP